ncbi:MAG: response regulator [Rhodospirillaceae bacterium]
MDGADRPPGYASWRFLVVDDKAFIRFVVQGMLQRLGAKDIIEAANGEQARGLLRRYGGIDVRVAQGTAHGVDCVISDWNMHPVGGLELLRTLRAGEIEGVPPATCFIMLTSHAGEKTVRSAIALDANAYLAKPVSFEKLRKTVSAAMAVRIVPKPAEHYRNIGGLEIPPALKAAETQPPSWMPEIADPPRRAQFEARIREIRREIGDKTASPWGSDPIAIRNTRRENLNEISAGLVLAEDIFAIDRAPLVPAGTVFTAGLLGRLKDICGDDDAQVWVGDTSEAASDSPRP